MEAQWLFLLTDVDRLYTADPRQDPNAKPITIVHDLSELESIQAGGQGSRWGTGGMATKLTAAKIATQASVRTVITQGRSPENLLKILAGEAIGTWFEPQPETVNARKRWIAHGLVPTGKLLLDAGAVQAIQAGGKSLLAAGIQAIEGDFEAQDAVQLCDLNGTEIARGLVNYDSHELQQIRGCQSDQIVQILGYEGAETIVHRDNLVLS